ncbi:hypothetical protein [Amycolatopsis sp. NPDC098790]|uniref:hypothetical protein n=1 Tax=Amycolatopsis sp. NPDC098790 TaxID=3363939 RepID=UPI0038126245
MVLGIQEIPSRASIALPMVALVTVLGGLETFFNWRSRWQEFFDRHHVTWADASRQWVEFRRLDRPPQSPEIRA